MNACSHCRWFRNGARETEGYARCVQNLARVDEGAPRYDEAGLPSYLWREAAQEVWIRRDAWCGCSRPNTPVSRRGPTTPDWLVAMIRRDHWNGRGPSTAIARRRGVSDSAVRRIVRGSRRAKKPRKIAESFAEGSNCPKEAGKCRGNGKTRGRG